jgi:osmoprotectant transport system permease protein
VTARTALLAQDGPVIPDFGRGSECVRENRIFCWDWASEHWDDTLQPRLIEHVQLTLIAVGLGLVFALAAALVVHRARRLETPIAVFFAVLYTVPSLALFQLLVPFTGLTVTTVEIALVGYTLLILFRNILSGLRGVPEDVLDAARGMGLTPTQTLFRVELPLALPALIAGIRIATVTTISLATVGAFLIPEGLGAPIFDGLRTGFQTRYIAAGLLAVALALVADALLVGAGRVLTPWAQARRVA